MAGAAVIAGLGGDLIAHAFVEHELLPALARDGQLAVFERQLAAWWRRVAHSLGPASSARSVHDVAVAPLLELLGYRRPVATPHALGFCGEIPGAAVVCLTLPWATPVRVSWRVAATSAIAARAPWAVVCNARSFRLIDCTRTWTHKGIEFDLAAIAANPAAIAVFWRLAHARFVTATDRPSLRSAIEHSDLYAARVCVSLGDGVLEALPRLATALAQGDRRPAGSTLDQALTLVYRILFLLFAEARGLVPAWHELYHDAYSIDALARRAMRNEVRGSWAALRAISRLAHAGCKAGDLTVTAFNGRLFSPRHAPLIEQRRIPDTVAADVLLALATEQTASARRRISYHDLGVEQLGSVYERVLDYEPVAAGRTVRLARTSTERKSTGSFYTPRSITEFLVRRTLAPLVDGRTADEMLRLRVVDPAMGSGAFVVAACRFLAEQCEQAYVRDGRWIAGEVGDTERAMLRRHIAERCLFGVDLNPTAVQLARLSLWLTTMAGERPLTFLDHHLAAGNSLLGARLADLSRPMPALRRQARERDLPLLADQLADTFAAHVLPMRLRIASTPSDSIDAVRAKERMLAELTSPCGPAARWSGAADAWCAAMLAAKRPSAGFVAELIAAATGSPTTLPAPQLDSSLRDARRLAADHGAFHWELAFPEVFFDAGGRPREDGGFDAVIGNPPWDMLRADTGTAAARATERSATAATLRFYRNAGSYRLQGTGHTNRYQLFLERALQLARHGGRVGLILPSGIATDHGSAALRRHLLERTSVDTWLGFDNRRRIFPIHRSMRFVVMATTNSGSTAALRFRTGLSDPRQLDADDAAPLLTVSRSRIESWSPDLAIPEITDGTALAILNGVSARIPALGDPAGWNVRFGRELNATDDRPHFAVLPGARRALLPIIEGKLLSPFQLDLSRAAFGIDKNVALRLIGSRSFERSRIGYRDVASATNKLTLIAALLPPGAISTHTVFVSKTTLDDASQWCLLGLMNSFVANFLVRIRVMTHVGAALMARLPMPFLDRRSRLFEELADLAQVIATKGVEAAAVEYARANAVAALAYGLTSDQYRYVTATLPLVDARVRAQSLDDFALLERTLLPRFE